MEDPTIMQTIADNWAEILVLFLVFVKGVLNLIPSQQPTVVFSFLDWAIDYLIPNRMQNKSKKRKG